MARRIIAGLVLTLVLLVGTRELSKRDPVDAVAEGFGMKLGHRTLTEHSGTGQPRIRVRLDPMQNVGMIACYRFRGSDKVEYTSLFSFEENWFEGHLPNFGKGTRLEYWIRAVNTKGEMLRVPSSPATLKYKGKVSESVLVAHIAFMFAAFFFMVMSLFGAIRILRGQEGKRSTVAAARWVLVMSLIGGWPLGFILNRQAFGTLWEGYPFGYDITDNKTQVMFVLWLASLLLVRGSFLGRGEEKDRLGARPFAYVIIASFLVSLVLFILPHSI